MEGEKDRKEKLRAAKEKLKHFQSKKKKSEANRPPPQQQPEPSDDIGPPPELTPENTSEQTSLTEKVSDQFSEQTSLTEKVSDQFSEQTSDSLTENVVNGNKTDEGEEPDDNSTEKRNRELNSNIDQYAVAIKQYEEYSRSLVSQVDSLKESLEKSKVEHKKELEAQSQSFKAQLDSHIQSIQFLVSEKAEVEASVQSLKWDFKNKSDECQKLEKKVQELTEQLQGRSPDDNTKWKAIIERLEADNAALKKDLASANNTIMNLKQEMSELDSKLSTKLEEGSKLEKLYLETKGKLEIAELNLIQIKNGMANVDSNELEKSLAEKDEEIRKLIKENEEQVKRVSELTTYIQQASAERDQIINQYTSYSQQLAAQIEAIDAQLNLKIEENLRLVSRESELVAHIESLETQLQKDFRQKQPNNDVDNNVDLDKMMTEIKALKESNEDFRQKVEKLTEKEEHLTRSLQKEAATVEELKKMEEAKESQIENMEAELEMLRAAAAGNEKLNEGNENLLQELLSDKVAASRAIAQNLELKKQLEELQTAIITLTNSKAKIMDELDNLKGRNEASTEEKLKLEINGLRSAIDERDLINNQLKDQMRFYVAFAENSIGNGNNNSEQVEKLMKDLQDAKEEIRCLNSHNSELRDQLEVLASRTQESSRGTPLTEVATMLSSSPSRLPSSTSSSSSSSSRSPSQALTSSSTVDDNSFVVVNGTTTNNSNKSSQDQQQKQQQHEQEIPLLGQDVATLKLEQKFHKAMAKIAELMGEKEHLEHLVIQLEEETETVGEYITLYQYQRSQQKRHMEEKERQLQTISRDREELKSKLEQLQSLVMHFLTKNDDGVIPVPSLDKVKSQVLLPPPPLEKVKEAIKDGNSSALADEIVALISEIGSNQILNENFHPWFWEPTGSRLITI